MASLKVLLELSRTLAAALPEVEALLSSDSADVAEGAIQLLTLCRMVGQAAVFCSSPDWCCSGRHVLPATCAYHMRAERVMLLCIPLIPDCMFVPASPLGRTDSRTGSMNALGPLMSDF